LKLWRIAMNDPYVKSLLSEHERILLVTRQHWFVLLKAVLIEIVLAVLIVVGVILGTTVFVFPLAAIGLILLIIPVVSFLYDYLVWSNRRYIVTNRRVMQIAGIFNKNVTDSSLEKVNDVKMEQSFWGRIFEFGDIEILTASELGANMFRTIGDPIHFKTAMLNAKEELEQYNARPGDQDDEDIPTLISRLDDLRKKGVITDIEFQQKKAELLAKM
jgi:uncharacterized membrane protein YdbT with pleckstrin-like domain